MRTRDGVELSRPQARLLRELGRRGQVFVSGNRLRTARKLQARGFVDLTGGTVIAVLTGRGREVADELVS